MARDPLEKANGNNEGVGYGRPPQHTQIKAGEKRNPYGRRGKPKPPTEFLDELVTITIEGKPQTITRGEALDYFLFMRAARGSVSAIRHLELRSQRRAAASGQIDTNLTPSEEAAFERYIRREAERLNRKDQS